MSLKNSEVDALAKELINQMNAVQEIGNGKILDAILQIKGIENYKKEIAQTLFKIESECSHLPIFQELKNKFT